MLVFVSIANTKLSPEGRISGDFFRLCAVLLPVVTVKSLADDFNDQTRFDGDK